MIPVCTGFKLVCVEVLLASTAEDYWLTLAAGLQVLGFTMLALDTSSSAAEALTPALLHVLVAASAMLSEHHRAKPVGPQ